MSTGVKITELTALSATPSSSDVIPIVDVSDTTQAVSGTTKKITAANVRAGLAASGANSDITSLTGLTTPLTSSQGGTGISDSTGDGTDYTSVAIQNALVNNLPPYGTLPKRSTKVIPQITPVDWYPDLIHASDGTYLYGQYSASTDTLVRYPINSHTATVGAQVDAGVGKITYIATTRVPGLIFIHSTLTSGSSGNVYRSTDYGATATKVLELGSRNQSAPVSGSRSDNVRWLSNRSFCDAIIAGESVMFILEYNVNGSRTTGGANDAVCLYKSVDLGINWTIAAEWNTDGDSSYDDTGSVGNYCRHGHAVMQSPVDDKIYLLFGDVGTLSGVSTNTQAGFIQWDGIVALPSNQPISAYTGTGLKNLNGKQKYRACDILWEDDYFYYMADATAGTSLSPSKCGVWKVSYDLTSHTRVSYSGMERATSAGRLGLKHPNGNHLWVEDSGTFVAGNYMNHVHTSSSDLSYFAANGVLRCKTTTTSWSPNAFFYVDEKIYLHMTSGNGIGKSGTTVCQLDTSLAFNGERPDTISPVYWVDKDNGTDDGTTTSRILRGNGPGTDAFKTLQYALTSSRVPYGARVILGAGTYSESTSINPVFLSTNADTTEHVNISGAGKELTIVGNNSSASDWLFGPTGSLALHYDFQDIRLTSFKSGSLQTVLLFSSYTYSAGNFKVRLIRAEVGKRRGDISATTATDDGFYVRPIRINSTSTAVKMALRMVDSGLVYKNADDVITVNTQYLLTHSDSAGVPLSFIDAERSYFWGGILQHGGATSTMKLINCIFGGMAHATGGNIGILASAEISPKGFGNRFECGDVSKQINNASTLPIVGAGQLGKAITNQVLNDSSFFDTTASILQPTARIKDPAQNDYTILPIY